MKPRALMAALRRLRLSVLNGWETPSKSLCGPPPELWSVIADLYAVSAGGQNSEPLHPWSRTTDFPRPGEDHPAGYLWRGRAKALPGEKKPPVVGGALVTQPPPGVRTACVRFIASIVIQSHTPPLDREPIRRPPYPGKSALPEFTPPTRAVQEWADDELIEAAWTWYWVDLRQRASALFDAHGIAPDAPPREKEIALNMALAAPESYPAFALEFEAMSEKRQHKKSRNDTLRSEINARRARTPAQPLNEACREIFDNPGDFPAIQPRRFSSWESMKQAYLRSRPSAAEHNARCVAQFRSDLFAVSGVTNASVAS